MEKPSSYYYTSKNENRGYIQAEGLRELWFHTGTTCNLSCPFCLEGSKPGDTRLEAITLEDVKPFVEQALEMGVEKFSFTGGEPFVIKEVCSILHHCLEYKPCLVLTNGTDPLLKRIAQVKPLGQLKNSLHFRISFDWPDEEKHDQGRGQGNFRKSLDALRQLYDLGFGVSVARQALPKENEKETNELYFPYLEEYGLPLDIKFVAFPDFMPPGTLRQVPEITENCMTKYLTEKQRRAFMCNFSRMIIKKNGRMRIYSCTLVDDDELYDMGNDLPQSIDDKVLLGHHRCYSCFAFGASCSEG